MTSRRKRDSERYFRTRRREFLYWLKDRPCADCGFSFNPVCMDFDHVRGEKRFNVATSLYLSWQRLCEELMKCEVVCANCHRLRTAGRKK